MNKISITLLTVITLLMCGSPLSAAGVRMSPITQFCLPLSEIRSVAFHEDYAYVNGEMILDISDPKKPYQTGRTDFPASGDVAVWDRWLWVFSYRSGLHIYDIETPINPVERNQLVVEEVIAFTSDSCYAFFGSFAEGHITKVVNYDLTNPLQPEIAGTYSCPDWYISQMKIQGGNLYVRNEGIVYIVDMESMEEVGRINLERSAVNFTFVGHFCYLVFDTELTIYDVSNPSEPSLVKILKLPGWCDKLWPVGNYCWLQCAGKKLLIVDHTDPSNPILSSVREHKNDFTFLTIYKGLAYIGINGLHIWDISDLFEPFELSYYDHTFGIKAVTIVDNICYTGDLRHLHIYDVTDESRISKLASHPVLGGVQDVNYYDSLLWVTTPTELQIYQLTDPVNPVKIGQYEGSYKQTVFGGQFAFCVSTDSRIDVLDISDPANPALTEQLNLAPVSIAFSDGRLYVGVRNGIVLIYSVTDEGKLVWLTNYLTASPITALNAEDGICYIGINNGKLLILDVSDPKRVRELHQVATDVGDRICLDGQFCYLSGNWFLNVFNIYNPSAPLQTGYITETGGRTVSRNGNYLYAANDKGIQVYNTHTALLDVDPQSETTPRVFTLATPYPNPFNSSTTVPFTLTHTGMVRLTVWDTNGREEATIFEGKMSGGKQTVTWSADGLPAGIHIIKLETQNSTVYTKTVLMK